LRPPPIAGPSPPQRHYSFGCPFLFSPCRADLQVGDPDIALSSCSPPDHRLPFFDLPSPDLSSPLLCCCSLIVALFPKDRSFRISLCTSLGLLFFLFSGLESFFSPFVRATTVCWLLLVFWYPRLESFFLIMFLYEACVLFPLLFTSARSPSSHLRLLFSFFFLLFLTASGALFSFTLPERSGASFLLGGPPSSVVQKRGRLFAASFHSSFFRRMKVPLSHFSPGFPASTGFSRWRRFYSAVFVSPGF